MAIFGGAHDWGQIIFSSTNQSQIIFFTRVHSQIIFSKNLPAPPPSFNGRSLSSNGLPYLINILHSAPFTRPYQAPKDGIFSAIVESNKEIIR